MTRHFAPHTFTGIRNNTGVKEENLRKYVPSIFATEAHESRSDRYEFIPTWNVLQAMQKEGFVIVSAQQARTRDVSKREYTKHLLRIRHRDDIEKRAVVGDTVFELLLKNSHDGTSLYELMGGLFRFVCANGMVVGDHLMEPLKVMHKGNVADGVIEASYSIIEDAPKVNQYIEAWKALALNPQEQLLFAAEAAKLRFENKEEKDIPVTPQQLLLPKRPEDTGNSLWATFNRVQENCIKGGMEGRTRDARNRLVRRSVRQVKGIDQDVRLNKALWNLAEGMQKLKQLEVV